MTGLTLSLLAVAWIGLARVRRPEVRSRVPARALSTEPTPTSEWTPSGTSRVPDPDALSPARCPARTWRRWVPVAALAVAVTVAAGPLLGGLVLAGPAVVRWRRDRRRQRDAEAAVVDQVPEVVDLLALALGAGLTVTEAMAAVGRWAPGPVGDALADASGAVRQGRAVGDALDEARDRCGRAAAPLFAAVVAAVRYGTSLGPSLDRLGHEARLDRRRAAEERARKVPVQLLFPLVVCVLPAFGLLTVVPLLVNSLGALAG